MKLRAAMLGLALLAGGVMGSGLSVQAQTATPEQVRAIAKEATIYGFPMVDNYRVQYSYFADPSDPEYKAGWNTLVNNARVYTPADTAIQTPNSDTPYSYVGADLRAEPLVLTVPEVEPGRYYSLQFIDQYTYNFAYVGSRATGNEAGNFLLVGPGWSGETPAGIKEVIRSETDFVFVLYRTQLFGPDDLPNVEKVQAGYKVQPLSAFLGQPAPAAASSVDFIKPLSAEGERTSLEFFNELNFILQFAPVDPSETELRARLASAGIEGGKTIDFASLSPEMRQAYQDGVADGWAAFQTYKETEVETGKKTSADFFGTRAFLNGDYMARMAGAVLGIYGNSEDEAIYPGYFADADGNPTSGANRYTMRFAPGQLPPVNAFWSLTMYKMPESLLSANPINRYLINSPMLPDLQKDADGGITIYIQNDMPAKGLEANWLPAPEGPFQMAMRLYWPKQEALDGTWKPPVLERVE
ncbi:MAG: cell envelope protein [Cereibacter sphaeroides]|uniref:Cell envelope protein n=1 Tax=Cereibacter sphaeroides TaxID=1063 RepID=A0A2W5UR78_CERSP|nr:MAG: cell envelope protein [Cereibacter sphaeroides]